MLWPCPDPPSLIRHWAHLSPDRRVIAHWLAQAAAPEDAQPQWFTDSLKSPRAVMRLHGADCCVHGTFPAVRRVLEDLLAGRFAAGSAWPDAAAQQAWERLGRRELHLSRVLPGTLFAARASGFIDAREAVQPYYCAHAWVVEGEPRFAGNVQHPCREVAGDELFPLFLEGNARHEENYLRACLLAGPSFVCEVAGEPVSWSLTHLGGAVGRIYTPQEHRGKGYARSLIALQADVLLRLRGMLVASVRIDNEASYRIFMGLGGRRLKGPMTWSTLLWPD